jgi:replicative DNA helicase Mcm
MTPSGTADYLEKKADEKTDFEHATISTETVRRLAEACARLDYKETVGANHVDIVTDLVNRVLVQMHRKSDDKNDDQSDGTIVTTRSNKTQRVRIKNIKDLISEIEEEFEEGAPIEEVLKRTGDIGMGSSKAEQEIEKLRYKGDLYEPREDHLRTT